MPDDHTTGGPDDRAEHYRAAELLLAETETQPGEASVLSILTAQVHCTLAVAAAAPGTARADVLA